MEKLKSNPRMQRAMVRAKRMGEGMSKLSAAAAEKQGKIDALLGSMAGSPPPAQQKKKTGYKPVDPFQKVRLM